VRQRPGPRIINHFVEHGGDIIELRNRIHNTNGSRNALLINSPHRWVRYRDVKGDPVIPYVITGKFSPAERNVILGAMRVLNANSCIRFNPRTKNQADFVDIQNKQNQGVGRYSGRNVLMLESNGWATCIGHDIVIHELLHVVGLWHEHMRFDRDKYINVLFKNIAPIYFDQFTKVSSKETRSYGVPYDYGSVMHYAKDVFGKREGLTTMQTRNRRYQNVIGRVKTASAGDYVKICTLYGCKQCRRLPFRPAPPSAWLKG
ncbi:Protein NAS-5, partial [Aphelenchoides avenae]